MYVSSVGRIDFDQEATETASEGPSRARPDHEVESRDQTHDHAEAAMGARDGVLTERSVTAMQRTAGNRAASTVVQRQRIPVQRAVTTEVEEGVDKVSNTMDLSGAHIGQWSGAAQFQQVQNPSGSGTVSNYTTGNTSTPGAIGGISGSGIGTVTGITSTVLASIGAHEGRMLKNEEEKQGRKGWAGWRVGSRGLKSGATTAASSGVNVGSQVLSGVSGVSQVMANAGSTTAFAGMNNLIGGVGGIVAMPVQAFQIGRTAWKLHRQNKRFLALRQGLVDPNTSASEALKAFDRHNESIQVLKETKTDLESAMAANRSKIGKYKPLSSKRNALQRSWMAMNGSLGTVTTEISRLEALTPQMTQQRDDAQTKLREMVTRSQNGQETAEDIQLYAKTKNQGGIVKKSIGIIGGAIGLGGGIAATIGTLAFASVGLAASVAVAATPVGWAMGGLAALIGLGMAGYAFWKWFSKRLDRAKKQEGLTGAKAFFTALNPFKKVGTSHREHMAQRLWDLANSGSDAEKTKSKEVIEALGLDWNELHMDDPTQKEHAIKLIHDKMGS